MSNLPQRPRIGNQRPTPGNQRPDVRRLPNSRRQQGSPETRPVPGKRELPPRRDIPQRPAVKKSPVPEKPVRPNVNKKPATPRPRDIEEQVVPSTPERKERLEDREEPVIYESYEALGEREPQPHSTGEVIPEGFEYDTSDTDEAEDVTDHLNDYDEESAEFFSENETDNSPVKDATEKKRKKKKPPKEKPSQSQLAMQGGRGKLIWVRVIAVTLFVILFGIGMKNTFLPPKVPGPDQVVSVVNENNNVLGFPVGEGSIFVQEFAIAYLTVERVEGKIPEEEMKKYVSENKAAAVIASMEDEEQGKQNITNGPFVSPIVEQIDEYNAIFTVSAQINGKWIYLDVPVHAGEDKKSFVVSGSPSFVSPPATDTEFVNDIEPRTKDAETTIEVEDDIETFFRAWGASDSDTLARLIAPSATPEVTLGLRGAVELSQITEMNIFEASDNTNPNVREGTARVVWISVKGEEDRNTTYTQDYNFVVERLDDGRWYVKDVKSGVTTQ